MKPLYAAVRFFAVSFYIFASGGCGAALMAGAVFGLSAYKSGGEAFNGGEAFGTGIFMIIAALPGFVGGILGAMAFYFRRTKYRSRTLTTEKVLV